MKLVPAEAQDGIQAAILKQITEGIILTDPLGTIVFVNEAAAAIHGVARLDVKPNAYSETYSLFREDGRPYPSLDLPLARAVRGETVNDARWLIRRPDGSEVLAIGTAQPLYGPTGRRIGAVLTLRDGSAQDSAERELRRTQSALSDAEARLAAHSLQAEARREAAATLEAAKRDASTAAGGRHAALAQVLEHVMRILGESSRERIAAQAAGIVDIVSQALGGEGRDARRPA